jgi:protein gp37
VRGCTKISPGCKNCYAKTFAERFRGVPEHPYEQGFDLRIVPEKLFEPLKWKRPRKIFVNSMSDLFHPEVPDDFIVRVAEVMIQGAWHTYQVLTKRAKRLESLLNTKLRFAAKSSHIWWGVSVEDRQYGLPRVNHLRNTPAAVKFISAEPLLEHLGSVDLRDIDWVIVGGESGPKARPIEEIWVQDLLEQCVKQRVRFFFKQWGGTNKKANGRQLNGRTYDELPIIQ